MRKQIVLIFASVVIATLHYLTPIHAHQFHAIFQRAFYVPIIVAAYYFNLRTAVAYAVFCGILYAPHIFLQWSFDPSHSFSQYVEITMYIIVSVLLSSLFQNKRQQQKLITSQQQELENEKRMGLLGKLAAGLAHEIRNPLGGLLGSAEIIKESLGEKHPKYEFVKIIESELKRVTKKLNEFLSFAKPNNLQKIPNNINDIVRAMLFLAKSEAEKLEASIETNLDPDIPLISMDAEQINQIVLNVILNSLHMMQKKGGVVISTEVIDSEVVVLFRDNGPGINPENMEKIFEPFFTTRNTGTGLGLAISRQIAERHGGTLCAIPQKIGACFELRLPNV